MTRDLIQEAMSFTTLWHAKRASVAVMTTCRICFFAVFAAFSVTTHAEPLSTNNPMTHFSPYISDGWQSKETVQIYRWGPNQNSVFSESLNVGSSPPQLKASGLWYYDPSLNQIKGIFVAKDMPFVVLHYTTRFEEGRMLSEIISIDQNGRTRAYLEQQKLSAGGETYDWTLTDAQDQSLSMSARFARVSEEP